ncbi:MAG: glycine--tRNA ligase [Candidatus Altiarchaeales archaeon]|nr:glycine--tRNA ligase [Candidatus Altiarchaeales archaeon]MBD3417226.1 glycine--tRNA ligase [Candidatus Altiarchaeales archaeon]
MQDRIMDVSKRRGIAYPSFEIYRGVSGFVDYGPIGSRIKQNIEDLLRRHYVIGEGCFEVQCPTLSPEEVWVASGHVDSFADLMVECNRCHECYRADKLLEEVGVEAEGKPAEEVDALLKERGITCPECKGGFGEPYEYNLMFQTTIGTGKGKRTGYLRPETAQSTYLGFRRLWEYARRKLPFGAIQIGHSFRNEISPRQGMIRLREFNQAEIQFFMDPDDKSAPRFGEVADRKVRITDKDDNVLEMTIGEACERGVIRIPFLAYQLGKALRVFEDMGLDPKRLQLRQHREDERAFYSSDTWDVEFASDSFGRIELVGIADRTDYDLGQHMKHSGEDMKVSLEGRKFIPHVMEVAYGIDRPFYCVLESCFREDDDRTYFSFPKKIAPYTVGVYSLVKKDGVPEKTEEVFGKVREAGFFTFIDHSGSIGKRYARADEIGVPYCITVDYETLEDDSVTVRDRDSKKQDRVLIGELIEYLR